MTDTKTTTMKEIERTLNALKQFRNRRLNIVHVRRWMDESKAGLSGAKSIHCHADFRRDHASSHRQEFHIDVVLPDHAMPIVLLLAQESCDAQIAELEQWLDARQIEHVESAKAD